MNSYEREGYRQRVLDDLILEQEDIHWYIEGKGADHWDKIHELVQLLAYCGEYWDQSDRVHELIHKIAICARDTAERVHEEELNERCPH